MTDAVRHRGPDAEGYWADQSAGIFLGHRRLSIIDLSPAGAQPMVSASGRYVITFNGEIYNFQDLRSELETRGARFRGHSDTEVLLAGIEQWGLSGALKKSAGMFALALWDRRDRRLSLARDRVGEKPLYYGWSGRSFLFGSELKALRAHPAWRGEIDRCALSTFVRYSYIPAPHSIYRGIRKVQPGTVLTIRPDRVVNQESYWSMAEAAERGTASRVSTTAEETVEQLHQILARSIRQQMISDVPLGAFLSGGVDSSLVVALMQSLSARPVRTFTICFEDAKYDESSHAAAVARHLGTNHHALTVTSADALAVIPSLPAMYDEPFADSSQIPTHLVSKLAREHVTVSLSGDGGDEFFAGYPRYAATLLLWRNLQFVPRLIRTVCARSLRAVPAHAWDKLLRNAPKTIRLRGLTGGDRVHKLASVLTMRSLDGTYQRFLEHWSGADPVKTEGGHERPVPLGEAENPPLRDPLHWLMHRDSVTYLPDDILVKVDRAAMAVGLETRAPFVDHRVVEFAWQIPVAQLLGNGRGKLPLRRLLDRFVPRDITERPKMGFAVPLEEWLRRPLRDWAEELLAPARLKREGFFDTHTVRERWAEHSIRERRWHDSLWNVLMFEAWLDRQ